MLDLTRCDPGLLQPIGAVVSELLAAWPQLRAADMMVVGAGCRDILQSALSYEFALRATSDIDLGLAVSNWTAYDELTTKLPTAGNTGSRYNVAGVATDLMPFGAVEDPTAQRIQLSFAIEVCPSCQRTLSP